jgi:hypothetical protein
MHSECRSQRRSRECSERVGKEGRERRRKQTPSQVRGARGGWKVDFKWLLQERARLLGGRGPGKKGRRARVGPVHWPPRVQATPEDSVAASPLMKRLVEMIIL